MKSKITLKKIGIISCAILLTAAFAGGIVTLARHMTLTNSGQATTGQNETTATNLSSQPSASSTENYIGESEAKAIALTHAGVNETDVTHMLCKLDYDDGVAEYEVAFLNGTTEYDYEISAVNGDILGYDYDMESYDTKSAQTSDESTATEYISESEAKSIALTHAGVNETDVTHMLCKLDYDDGVAEYEVEWTIGRIEYEYTIKATDGMISEHDVESDD